MVTACFVVLLGVMTASPSAMLVDLFRNRAERLSTLVIVVE